MQRRMLPALFAIFLLLTAAGAMAAEKRLDAPAISATLSGATIEGSGGEAYRQVFHANGLTLYTPSGSHPDQGKWRVDEKNDHYCSWWERGGWSCYEVWRDGETIIWKGAGFDYRSTSVLVETE